MPTGQTRDVDTVLNTMRQHVAGIIEQEIPKPEHSFGDIINGVSEDLSSANRNRNNVVHQIARDPKLLADLEQRLGPHRRFGFVGSGDHGIALSFEDAHGQPQILRITNAEEPYFNKGTVLNPTAQTRVGNITIQTNEPVAPIQSFIDHQVISHSEADAVMQRMQAHLYKDGLNLADEGFGNAAMTRTGRLAVPDLGALQTADERLDRISKMSSPTNKAHFSQEFEQIRAEAASLKGGQGTGEARSPLASDILNKFDHVEHPAAAVPSGATHTVTSAASGTSAAVHNAETLAKDTGAFARGAHLIEGGLKVAKPVLGWVKAIDDIPGGKTALAVGTVAISATIATVAQAKDSVVNMVTQGIHRDANGDIHINPGGYANAVAAMPGDLVKAGAGGAVAGGKDQVAYDDFKNHNYGRAAAHLVENNAVPFATNAYDAGVNAVHHYESTSAVPQKDVDHLLKTMPKGDVKTNDPALKTFLDTRDRVAQTVAHGVDYGGKVGRLPYSQAQADFAMQNAAREYLISSDKSMHNADVAFGANHAPSATPPQSSVATSNHPAVDPHTPTTAVASTNDPVAKGTAATHTAPAKSAAEQKNADLLKAHGNAHAGLKDCKGGEHHDACQVPTGHAALAANTKTPLAKSAAVGT